jgi:hypothetical protein
MKALFLSILGLLLLFGCAAPPEAPLEEPAGEIAAPPPEAPPEEPPEAPAEEPMVVTGDEGLTVIKISAAESDGGWRFPLELYDGEFESVGLYSDSFIQLNKSHILFLDEGEAVWLTPTIDDGKGVLFNAIHSNEIEGCDASTVTILGKSYDLAALKSCSNFENDDRWKVALDEEDGCLKRVVIHMEGYFYDVESDEQISIFRNDNTLLIQFKDLESKPKVRLIATKPPEEIEVKKEGCGCGFYP